MALVPDLDHRRLVFVVWFGRRGGRVDRLLEAQAEQERLRTERDLRHR